jgi:hypothetical protein
MQAIGFLLMALSFLAVPLGGAVWLYARRTGRPALARTLLLMGGGWVVLYLGLLLVTSMTSEEIVLDQGERKAFCGFYLDCYIGATVEEVTTSKRLGSSGQETIANGLFHLVTVTFSSDARQAALSLAHPDAVLMDAQGRRYIRNRAAEQALSENAAPLPASIQNGQIIPQTFVFDVPPSAEGLKLHVTMGDALGRFVEAFLIGDDDSLLHRRTLLKV